MKHIKIGQRRIWMHKGIIEPNFGAEHVLSEDPWQYVELWLRRKRSSEALSYWTQARRFAEASKSLSPEAAPLTLYYEFLNSAKALLIHQKQNHGNYHGVVGERPENARASLVNETVKFQTGGILPSLCDYFGESVRKEEYSLKNILYNIPYIHRAFCLTFTSSKDLFIPIESARYVRHADTREAWFEAEVAPRYCDGRTLATLPSSFEHFSIEGKTFIRRRKRFRWSKPKDSSAEKSRAIKRIQNYHAPLRRVVVNIYGNRDLWYIKRARNENPAAARHTITLMFAAMHRLSELSRYDPAGLDRHLSGQANWLISEFVNHAMDQYIDQIASEITGLQFWPPKMRV